MIYLKGLDLYCSNPYIDEKMGNKAPSKMEELISGKLPLTSYQQSESVKKKKKRSVPVIITAAIKWKKFNATFLKALTSTTLTHISISELCEDSEPEDAHSYHTWITATKTVS